MVLATSRLKRAYGGMARVDARLRERNARQRLRYEWRRHVRLHNGAGDEALERVRAAFVGAGWSMAPIRTRDMLVFARGDAVAAVLAEEVAAGTRLTAIQRKSGL